jgi:hypothetical protein
MLPIFAIYGGPHSEKALVATVFAGFMDWPRTGLKILQKNLKKTGLTPQPFVVIKLFSTLSSGLVQFYALSKVRQSR